MVSDGLGWLGVLSSYMWSSALKTLSSGVVSGSRSYIGELFPAVGLAAGQPAALGAFVLA